MLAKLDAKTLENKTFRRVFCAAASWGRAKLAGQQIIKLAAAVGPVFDISSFVIFYRMLPLRCE